MKRQPLTDKEEAVQNAFVALALSGMFGIQALALWALHGPWTLILLFICATLGCLFASFCEFKLSKNISE